MKCALCETKECYKKGKDCTGERDKLINQLKNEDMRIMEKAAKIEADYYMVIPRLKELIEFCKIMKFKRIGIAFCIGLAEEAKVLHRILGKEFEVFSVCCKVCGIGKDLLKLEKLHKNKEFEATCNPIGQALILNESNTNLNVVVGLCIGHDILFSKYSNAPVTTLVVKDRVLAHNPIGAIYSGYYREKLL
ncbi:MAG: DUF1847 domain-containing protein [Candidatus Bathyarchaeia archaeon]